LDFVAPYVAASTTCVFAPGNGTAGNGRFKPRRGVTEWTQPGTTIATNAAPDLRLRVQPAAPAPFDLVDDMKRQQLSHNALPLRREHDRSLSHRLPFANADDSFNMDIVGLNCQLFRSGYRADWRPNRLKDGLLGAESAAP